MRISLYTVIFVRLVASMLPACQDLMTINKKTHQAFPHRSESTPYEDGFSYDGLLIRG